MKLQYDGPFDRVEICAAGEWYTASRGEVIDATGAQLDAFRESVDWTPVEPTEDGDEDQPAKKRPAKKIDGGSN